jgi:tetrapyrrole methylase family protein/MazG family protein
MVTDATRLADGLADLLARAGLDVADGVSIVAVDRLASRPFDPGMALVVLPAAGRVEPGVTAALPGRHAHGPDALTLLRRLYPLDHPVLGAEHAGRRTVGTVTQQELSAAPHVLPPLDAVANVASPYGIAWLADRLRQPDGCPWDREQDHRTLRPFLLEETYEVYDALDDGSTAKLAEELGDLLLQVILHAQYAAEDGVFDLVDVQRSIMTKIVRRHPHVFADVEAATASDVMRNWEQLKAAERAAGEPDSASGSRPARGEPGMPAAFAGLSRSLPALAYADEMQGRAAALGYDWPDLEGVIDKVAEEASELLAADGQSERDEEYGDLLFVIVNLGRKLGIDPEASLRAASRKFASRFARVERIAGERGVELRALGLDALDELWQEAKAEERETP